jgi:hypothetical protein
MLRDFPYCPTHNVTVQYKGGVTYSRVPEAAVAAITAAKAGEIVNGVSQSERGAVQKADQGSSEGSP